MCFGINIHKPRNISLPNSSSERNSPFLSRNKPEIFRLENLITDDLGLTNNKNK